jgi:hypothetical protein
MNRGRTRWLLRLGVPLAVGVGALVWLAVRGDEVLLTVENHSGQVLQSLEIKAGGKATALTNVANGAEKAVALPGRGHFEVTGRLADGTLIRGSFGQFGDSSARRARLAILPEGKIAFRLGDKPPGR